MSQAARRPRDGRGDGLPYRGDGVAVPRRCTAVTCRRAAVTAASSCN